MAGLSDLVKKAVYLGVGIASYAAEKAEGNLQEIKNQAQKLADEMIARGEMTTDEARKYVDELVKQAQRPADPSEPDRPGEPRRIEIVDEPDSPPSRVEELRQQVRDLQEELRKIQNE
jgi:polyhydroxyalkanoate synthesis regulator phasin